jgi:hypothetical protein
MLAYKIQTPGRTYLPMKMEQTECSEMSAYKIQMPGNYPEESIQHAFNFYKAINSNYFKTENTVHLSHDTSVSQ